MPLPRTLIYNDLTGDEIKHILITRFTQLLNDVPYLQKHITLPRVKMDLDVRLDCWADQPNPERQTISDSVTVQCEGAQPLNDPASVHKSVSVDASAKGDPPDKVRETHGLGVPTPVRGPLSLEDHVEGRRVVMPNGAIVDRTGTADDAQRGATIVKQDFGPMRERVARDTTLPLRNNDRREGPVTPPNWNNKE